MLFLSEGAWQQVGKGVSRKGSTVERHPRRLTSFTPGILQGLSRATIAAGLAHPSDPVTKLILGVSNYLSAGICSIDGGKPGAVCSSSGVRAAAKVLKLSV
jgi:hypothetical protein